MIRLNIIHNTQNLHVSVPRCSLQGIQNTGSADKSLARPGRKQATTTEDFYIHISYL